MELEKRCSSLQDQLQSSVSQQEHEMAVKECQRFFEPSYLIDEYFLDKEKENHSKLWIQNVESYTASLISVK